MLSPLGAFDSELNTMSDGPLSLVVVTPETTVLDVTAEYVVAPLYDGEIGIARNHAPLIGRLGYGELRFRNEGKNTRYFVEGGFVQVVDNVVSVMTGRAIPAEQIDVHQARVQLDEALERPATGVESSARERDIAQARGKLRVAKAGPSD